MMIPCPLVDVVLLVLLVAELSPEVLWAVGGLVGGVLLFGGAQYAALRAKAIRERYKATPSTDDDAAGEERAARWEAIHDVLARVDDKAVAHLFALHRELEGERHPHDEPPK